MNNSLLMSVLNGFANLHEQLQSLVDTQLVVVAVLSDRNSIDQFHHEIRTTVVCSARIKYACNIGMIHHRESLLLGLEPGDHILRVQFRFNQFQGHPTFYRLVLFGQPDDAHPALAELFNQAKVGEDGRRVDW